MTTFGIIGGVGPQATSRLYNGLITTYKQQHNGHAPEVFIYSLPVDYNLECNLISGKMDDKYVDKIKLQLKTAFNIMDRIHAQVVILACNTLTRYSCSVTAKPFKNPIDAVTRKVSDMGLKRVGILSTNATRKLRLFDQQLEKRNISCVYPSNRQQSTIVNYILSGLANEATNEYENEVLEILKGLSAKCDGIVIGCTDLFCIEKLAEKIDVPIIDSLDSLIHESIHEWELYNG